MNPEEYPLISTVFARTPESIWQFIELKDALNLSICSKFTASLGIDGETVEKYLEAKANSTHIGNFRLRFPQELTLGMMRRVLNRINTGTEAMVIIDRQSGRVMMDVGSALNDNDAFLASNVEPVSETASEQGEIFRHLEISSMDEYDDFNPRHPQPKDKIHRRGDSYFNSDIESVASELSAGGHAVVSSMDLKNIAAMALANEDHDSHGNATKNKFLAMKKHGGGVSPVPTGKKPVKKPQLRTLDSDA